MVSTTWGSQPCRPYWPVSGICRGLGCWEASWKGATAVSHSIHIRNTNPGKLTGGTRWNTKKWWKWKVDGFKMMFRISIEWFLGSSAIQASDDTKLTQPNTLKIDTFKQPITSITKYKKESLFQALFFCKGLLDHVWWFVPYYSTNFRVIFFTQINVFFVTISPQ